MHSLPITAVSPPQAFENKNLLFCLSQGLRDQIYNSVIPNSTIQINTNDTIKDVISKLPSISRASGAMMHDTAPIFFERTIWYIGGPVRDGTDVFWKFLHKFYLGLAFNSIRHLIIEGLETIGQECIPPEQFLGLRTLVLISNEAEINVTELERDPEGEMESIIHKFNFGPIFELQKLRYFVIGLDLADDRRELDLPPMKMVKAANCFKRRFGREGKTGKILSDQAALSWDVNPWKMWFKSGEITEIERGARSRWIVGVELEEEGGRYTPSVY